MKHIVTDMKMIVLNVSEELNNCFHLYDHLIIFHKSQ